MPININVYQVAEVANRIAQGDNPDHEDQIATSADILALKTALKKQKDDPTTVKGIPLYRQLGMNSYDEAIAAVKTVEANYHSYGGGIPVNVSAKTLISMRTGDINGDGIFTPQEHDAMAEGYHRLANNHRPDDLGRQTPGDRTQQGTFTKLAYGLVEPPATGFYIGPAELKLDAEDSNTQEIDSQ